jgi:eukaryotic-like serine/threonine-protein kinase
MIGSTVQKYRIERELGSGAMGAVYEAVDTLTERPVAMKVLRAELAKQPELIERFRSEAVTLARLNHPNIALLYDFFLENGDYYMAMEFVRGRSLELLIRQQRNLDASLAASIMRQTLTGLAHAHSAGVLHRDIKPANILVTDDMRVKVTDFGIARVLGSSRMTRHGRIIGTLEYIAPERIRGDETDPRSDLYAAGVVLYEMLSGKLPFEGNTDFALIKAHLEQDPPALAEIAGSDGSVDWNAIIARAMAKDPAQRFQTAEEFCQALPDQGFVARPATRPSGAIAPPQYASAGTGQAQVRPTSGIAAAAAVGASTSFIKKNPLMTAMLAATGVMTILLIVTLVWRVRANNEAKTDVPQTPAVETTQPHSQPPDPAVLTPVAGTPNGPNVIPGQTNPAQEIKPKTPGTVTPVDPEEQRRQAALRALDGKGSSSSTKDSKRAAALKALDH